MAKTVLASTPEEALLLAADILEQRGRAQGAWVEQETGKLCPVTALRLAIWGEPFPGPEDLYLDPWSRRNSSLDDWSNQLSLCVAAADIIWDRLGRKDANYPRGSPYSTDILIAFSDQSKTTDEEVLGLLRGTWKPETKV